MSTPYNNYQVTFYVLNQEQKLAALKKLQEAGYITQDQVDEYDKALKNKKNPGIGQRLTTALKRLKQPFVKERVHDPSVSNLGDNIYDGIIQRHNSKHNDIIQSIINTAYGQAPANWSGGKKRANKLQMKTRRNMNKNKKTHRQRK